ncbi:hypothetical protein AVEN_208269-1 [Araneus ventricosus]|uniref:DUF4817 domain-containing protein n=1 Tax=Araneus ventricosus TaxID=182803 RepID=A0A4Y2SCS5_ARAVE|nr:hypothetical protein AVEN_208269-1 [Araneus ventricosus]
MYSIEQMVLEYLRLELSPTATRRSFQKRFNVPKGPDGKTIRKLFAKFERAGSVDDNRVGNVGHRQNLVTPENVAKVSGIVQQNPRNSARRIASEPGLKPSSTQKILRNSLRMLPYKIQSHQAIPIKAVRQKFDFANEILTMIDNEGFDVGCIWFTDKAHFHLNGFVNKQKWRFWGSENPHLCEEKPLHSPTVTAWVAVCSRGNIVPFFISETISSELYITILEQFVSTQLVLEDRPKIEWFMQDGARPGRTEKVFRFLDEYFGNIVIALDYPKFIETGMDWPPYSPDLTPCDYFLWGALKDTVYRNHPSMLAELELAICVACNSISVETLKDVMTNFILRLRHFIFSNENFFNQTERPKVYVQRALETFERKVLRTIFGPVQEQGCYRTRYNFELYRLYKEPQVTQIIRSNRLRWLGHVWRTPENNPTRLHTFKNTGGARARGRPSTRWLGDTENDIKILKIKNWQRVSLDRLSWKKRAVEAATQITILACSKLALQICKLAASLTRQECNGSILVPPGTILQKKSLFASTVPEDKALLAGIILQIPDYTTVRLFANQILAERSNFINYDPI